jgi:hypothetical protein
VHDLNRSHLARVCAQRASVSTHVGEAGRGTRADHHGASGLCGRWRGLHRRRCLRVWDRLPQASRSEPEAPLEPCATGTATNWALAQLQARARPLYRPTTPGPRHPRFDGVDIIAESVGKPAPGSHGTRGGRRAPGLQLRGLPRAHEVGKGLGESDRLASVRMRRTPLGELWGVVLGARRLMAPHQPGRLTSGEASVVGLSDDGEG